MVFEKHLFISYAHIDNQPLTPEQQGWVSRFHASLEAILSMRLGRKAEIWRDQKLTGSDIFADEIVAQFTNTALLISVLTPRYIESDWCTREVREFCRVAEEGSGLVVQNKSRILKVIKSPVDSEERLPAVMKEVLGYPFYVFDDERTPLELDPAYGPEMTQKYNLKVAKLAWDITQHLKLLSAAAADPANVPGRASSKPSVYLAECSWDQRQAREALEADLRLHGYSILPERPLPRDEAGYAVEVSRLLGQAKLSVHLVGTTYGAVPDGPTQKSIVLLQNELAAAQSKSTGLRRVIWLPEGTTSTHAEQQRFIDILAGLIPSELHTSADAQCGADLIRTDLETFKNGVHAALEKLETPGPAPSGDGSDGDARLIYLICDERDRKTTIPIRKHLKAKGFDVQIPVFEGDATTVRRVHQDLLTRCDAVMVFYGAADDSWKRAVDSDLRKAKGYRGDAPVRFSYTYLATPVTDDKSDLIDMDEAGLINGLNGFSEPQLEPLVRALQGM